MHPVQKYCMDEKEIVETYGDDLAFWCGFDLQRLFPFGNVEDIRAETRFLADTFWQPHKGKMIDVYKRQPYYKPNFYTVLG